MLAGTYQVNDVLMLVACVAPVAIYFLTLGLVNSHARPYLVSSRSDFISLSIVLAPLLVLPVPLLAQAGLWWLLSLGVIALVGVFAWMLPSAEAGFVVYNITRPRCTRLIKAVIADLGWAGHWHGRVWQSDDGSFRIHVRDFALLRNVTVHCEAATGNRADRTTALSNEMQQRLCEVSQLPSTMGACLVVLGLGLMILPLWTVSRHIDDLVDAMSRLFG